MPHNNYRLEDQWEAANFLRRANYGSKSRLKTRTESRQNLHLKDCQSRVRSDQWILWVCDCSVTRTEAATHAKHPGFAHSEQNDAVIPMLCNSNSKRTAFNNPKHFLCYQGTTGKPTRLRASRSVPESSEANNLSQSTLGAETVLSVELKTRRAKSRFTWVNISRMRLQDPLTKRSAVSKANPCRSQNDVTVSDHANFTITKRILRSEFTWSSQRWYSRQS